MSVGLDRHAKSTCQTEVCKLNYLSILANEQVLWLEIPVEDPIRVQKDQ